MKFTELLVISCLLVVFGCHRTVRVAAPPPPPPPAPIPASLQLADEAFTQGDFASAAQSYETFLDSHIVREDMDRILFRSAVSVALNNTGSAPDVSGNENLSRVLNRLISEYPGSPYTPPARMVLGLRADLAKLQTDYAKLQADRDTLQKTQNDKIKQLSDELDRLKKIDLDRRRTP
jgi:hypothetical protein